MFKKRTVLEEEPVTMEALVSQLGGHFHGILRANLYEMNLDKEQMELLMEQKRNLRKALKNCGTGEAKYKQYIKSLIIQYLTEKEGMTEERLQNFIPFGELSKLTVQDQFEILFYQFKKKYKRNGLNELLHSFIWEDGACNQPYHITEEQIKKLYRMNNPRLDFVDKIEVVAQRVYQQYKGLGVVDEILDMRVDGVSGGTSGNGDLEESVWIFFQGKSVHLEFLSFGSEKELERICRNICRYGNPGQLSESRGYIIGERADHGRVVVARPPFCEHWVFFVRKFDSLSHKALEDLLTDSGFENPIIVLKWIMKGCQVTALTGAQGSGKTTLLMSLIDYIPAYFNLRIQELAFELHLRQLYPERNIVTFQETGSISGQEGLDLQKKTDGTVNILGEVATAEVASWMIQMGQTASLFTVFTHHATTAKNLVLALRNGLVHAGNFQNEKIAEQQVVDVIRFDVHMEKDRTGHRYIQRISEIVPLEMMNESGRFFEENIILRWEEGNYVVVNPITPACVKAMENHLNQKEKEEFHEEMARVFV